MMRHEMDFEEGEMDVRAYVHCRPRQAFLMSAAYAFSRI